MKRRTLLKAAGIGMLATTAGVWTARRTLIREAMRKELFRLPLGEALFLVENRQRLSDDLDAFDDALKQARRSMKPVLVIVIPEEEGEQMARADLISMMIDFGKNEDLALLTLAEIVCARMEWVRNRFPKAPAGEPWLLVIDVHTDPVSFFAVSPDPDPDPKPLPAELALQEFERNRPPMDPDDEKAQEEYSKKWNELSAQQRVQEMAPVVRLFRKALTSDPEVVKRRGALVEEELSGAQLDQVKNALSGWRVSDPLMERAAPMVYVAQHYLPPEVLPGRAEHLTEDMARVAISKYRVQDVPGSRWGMADICACGMGSTPMRSYRFLRFYNRLRGSPW